MVECLLDPLFSISNLRSVQLSFITAVTVRIIVLNYNPSSKLVKLTMLFTFFFVLCTNDGGSVAADGIHEVGQVEAAVHGLKKQTSEVSENIYLSLSPVLLWPQRPLRRP